MAKKVEIEKLSPGACLDSLRAYHEAVFMLVTTCDSVIEYIPNTQIRKILFENTEAVKSFYEQ